MVPGIKLYIEVSEPCVLLMIKILYFHKILWCGVGLAQVDVLWIVGSIPTRFTLL